MNKALLFGVVASIALLAGGFVWWQGSKEGQIASPYTTPTKENKQNERTLEKYAYENLKNREPQPSQIRIDEELSSEDGFSSHLFSFQSEGRTITGLLNMPTKGPDLGLEEATDSADLLSDETTIFGTASLNEEKFPVVVMIRGYVEPEDYETGVGTSRAGEYYAQNGFITLAPDFLGYGGSDDPPDNVWEERFLRPVAVMDLIASVESLPEVDPGHIFLWGHSNGGMIAMSVLELIGDEYPTTLWAPVSQSFPYDILYYTYEFDDRGKALRAALAEFEKDYDADNYSFDQYLEWINAPLRVHQGTADDYIPLSWSNALVERLKNQGNKVEYFTYTGADHNMVGAWNMVVARDLEFFTSFLTR
jgi:pimeloyl-ACP methyl ester carboxylesterase